MPAEILRGVSHADYHADNLPGSPHFSRSVAVTLLQRSPLHAWAKHPKLGGQRVDDEADQDPQKKARMEFGSLVHTLLLGGGQRIAICDYPTWQSNDSKAAKKMARENGLLPVLKHKHEMAMAAARKLRENLERAGVLLDPEGCELTMLWEDQGVQCKGRLDTRRSGVIQDLKVSEQTPAAFVRGIPYNGLDIQAYAYTSAIGTIYPELAGREDFEFLLCDPRPPHDVAVIPVGPAYFDLGGKRWNRALRKWAECLESGKWPGYGRQEPAMPPEWMLKEDFAFDLAAAETPDWLKGA